MSETTAYLIPKRRFDVGVFKSKIESTFEKLNLINGYYDDNNNWFAAGDNAYVLFAGDSLDENPPFEYIEIHDTENTRLIPEGLSEPVECKHCGTDVREDINDLLFTITEKEYDEKRETDIGKADILCPNCGKKSNLSVLAYQEKTVFTNQYVCFVAILDNLNEEKLAEIEKQIESPFEIIYSSI